MSRINGVKCDWCGNTDTVQGDKGLPENWTNVIVPAFGKNEDLCQLCTDAAINALDKAKKRCKTGRVQR